MSYYLGVVAGPAPRICFKKSTITVELNKTVITINKLLTLSDQTKMYKNLIGSPFAFLKPLCNPVLNLVHEIPDIFSDHNTISVFEACWVNSNPDCAQNPIIQTRAFLINFQNGETTSHIMPGQSVTRRLHL